MELTIGRRGPATRACKVLPAAAAAAAAAGRRGRHFVVSWELACSLHAVVVGVYLLFGLSGWAVRPKSKDDSTNKSRTYI